MIHVLIQLMEESILVMTVRCMRFLDETFGFRMSYWSIFQLLNW